MDPQHAEELKAIFKQLLTPSPESPAGWKVVPVELLTSAAKYISDEIGQGGPCSIYHRLVNAARGDLDRALGEALNAALSAAPEPSREQDMGEGNQGLSSDVQLTGHRPRVPRRERG
jgi:hypothetical protein